MCYLCNVFLKKESTIHIKIKTLLNVLISTNWNLAVSIKVLQEQNNENVCVLCLMMSYTCMGMVCN